ncbi:hypothetical protein C8R47DRAFT_1324450 [Mycena vitilis]|nr:hypothetical protein C8R47DRAFT_1324450 [Mycena vitilis]
MADAVITLSSNRFATLGSLEIGVLVAMFWSGIVTAQVLLYFQHCVHDSWRLKSAVAFCWALDVGHTIAIAHTLYIFSVAQYSRALTTTPISLAIAIMLSGFIGPLEQGWFTYRLYRLTKRRALPLFCTFLAIVRFGGIIALSAITLQLELPEYQARVGWLLESILVVSAVLDTVLVSALCCYLSSWRLDKSRIMHKVVRQIMTWTIEAGLVTIIGALGQLITFWTMKHNLVYVGFLVLQPKMFANSLLLSLNAREQFSELIHAHGTNSRLPVSMASQLEFPTEPPAVAMELRN